MAKNKTDNLIPLNKRTKNEQREITKKGGKESGRRRAERRTLKEELTALLEMVDEGETDTNNTRISVSIIKKALTGDVKAFEVIRDTIGEKPTDKVNLGSDGEPLTKINLVFGDRSERKKHKEHDPIIVDGGALKDEND